MPPNGKRKKYLRKKPEGDIGQEWMIYGLFKKPRCCGECGEVLVGFQGGG
jgi:hypothetical protein